MKTKNIRITSIIIWNIIFFKNSGTYMNKKKILRATDIWAVQMLKFIGSFYWLYKALNTHYEYKSTVHAHVKVWYCKMCSFVVLRVDGEQGLQIK